jgi:hypothetical protein
MPSDLLARSLLMSMNVMVAAARRQHGYVAPDERDDSAALEGCDRS